MTGNVVKTRSSHTCFCWCSYVTTYARVKLFRAFKALNFEVAYCDTDSIFTNSKIESSKELGELKEEYRYKEGHFIKAKHYGIVKYGKFEGEGFITYDKSVKIKGVRGATDENASEQTLKKVFKNKETLGNRRINPDTGKLYRAGEPITINKKISLLDEKRKWKDGKSEPYDVEELKLNLNLIEVKI
ncbi:DNA polymerase [Methanosarcina spherical virus]|nr:DNA polymerase [Methanosarcina spherical virus]